MHRTRWWLVASFLAGGLFLALLGSGIALIPGVAAPALLQPTSAPSVLITDRHGRLLLEVIDPNGSKQVPLSLSDIPLTCQQATIATEDRRFYSHPGVDLIAILRAAWGNLRAERSGDQSEIVFSGASTLTQQLARNLYLPPQERYERSLWRKLREAWLAWQIEQEHSKDEILALYLNSIYYGHFAVGIEAAAQAYFGVHADELDLAQCALLAGLAQNPTTYNPIENPDAARGRQAVVLDLMSRDGYITAQEAREALGERLAFASTPFPIQAPHFVMWVQDQIEETVGGDVFRRGGLRVTTTLDLDAQQRAEEIIQRRLALLQPCASAGSGTGFCDAAADTGRRVDNAALVALEPETGAVLAMVGSPDYFDATISGAVNGALSARQPGSAIKPITYAAALDPERAAALGEPPWTASTLLADVRTVFPTREGRPYVPLNYDRAFHGPVTVRSALANSYNIPAVKTLQHIGVDALVMQASRMGIEWGFNAGIQDEDAGTLAQDPESWMLDTGSWNLKAESFEADSGLEAIQQGEERGTDREELVVGSASGYGLALTLGGGEVRLLDLTTAFGVFANGGLQVRPHAIERIETLDGKTLFTAADSSPADRVLDARVAFLITDILSDEIARQPEFGAGNVLEIGRPAAAKTGTTTDWRDNWTIGYVPHLVTGVWVGNADNAPMQDVSGISGAGPIWHDFMTDLLQDQPAQSFPRPDGLRQVEVCADSGLLPGDAETAGLDTSTVARALRDSNPKLQTNAPAFVIVPCPNRRLEWFIEGTEPTTVDKAHVQMAMDVSTGRPAGPSAPRDAVRVQTFWALPDEYRSWAQENGIPQPPAASLTILNQKEGSELAIRGLQPPDGSEQAGSEEIHLTSPDGNRVYRMDPRLPEAVQRIAVTAVPGAALVENDAKVMLLLDGAPLAQVEGPDYTTWWQLQVGRHAFQAMAIGAGGQRVTSPTVTVLVQ